MDKRLIELSLVLFGVIPKGKETEVKHKNTLEYGFIVDKYAAYATRRILKIVKSEKLSAEQLNATFHKSWEIIKESSREDLFKHQILHYLTTYGSNFTSDYIYYPLEELTIPAITKLPIRVIKGVSKEELIEKSLAMLSLGVALDEKTIDSLLEVLSKLNYSFTNLEQIKNKEALVKIIAKTGVYPKSPTEFLRYLIYLTTDSTLLIKNRETVETIKTAKKDLSKHINNFGLKKCAEIFNRFKPLWLAFKSNTKNKALINEISRLSKRYHKPMPVDILNNITSVKYDAKDVLKALEDVNNFRKIRLLNALHVRVNSSNVFLYRIRNGKSFARIKQLNFEIKYYQDMYSLIYKNLIASTDLRGKTIKYPSNIDYALPTSEKMFVGNYPVGTKITSENLVSGVYWEDSWGVNDLDLSALHLTGKVGWDANYKAEGIFYSGDITDAPNGATELLYTDNTLNNPALSIVNIYSGKIGCKFKIIVGAASKVTENYMFNPNELILETESNMVGYQQILGIFIPEADKMLSFVLVNAAFGNFSTSSDSEYANNARDALFSQYSSPISLRKFFLDAGAIINSEKGDIDLSPQVIKKDSLLNLFK